MGRGVYNQEGGRRYRCFLDLYAHTNLCRRETHTHTHELTPMRVNCVPNLCMIEEKVAKSSSMWVLSISWPKSLSLSLSIPIYYITKSDNRKKQTQKDKKKKAKANKHDFDHVSMVYSRSFPPPPPPPNALSIGNPL